MFGARWLIVFTIFCFVSRNLIVSFSQEALEQTKDESELFLATTLEQKGKVDALLVEIQVGFLLISSLAQRFRARISINPDTVFRTNTRPL